MIALAQGLTEWLSDCIMGDEGRKLGPSCRLQLEEHSRCHYLVPVCERETLMEIFMKAMTAIFK